MLELADYYLSRGQWRAAAGDDRAAAQLVGEFSRQLASDAPSKAHALKHAQESLISNRRYRHPFYWSPFLLIGNWF
ncbi:MAG: CHAT domain-containing protein [Candidatus Competibacterales bacterium]